MSGDQTIIGGKLGVGTAAGVPFQVTGGSDASLSAASGNIISGVTTGANLVIDNNEIVARNNGVAAPLFLNAQGGIVNVGSTAVLNSTEAALDVRGYDVSGMKWMLRLSNGKAISNSGFQYAGGMRISNDGFLEITSMANHPNLTYARLNNAGQWSAVSDRRLKKDIEARNGFLEGALALQPVSYHYQGEEAKSPLHIGFIAQDVQEVFPDLVSGRDTLTLNYSGLSVVAIGAVKELAEQVEELKAKAKKAEELEAEVAALKTALAELKSQDKRLSRLEELERRLDAAANVKLAERR